MDTSRLGTGARVAGISAVVLLILTFTFGWFTIDSFSADAGNGASISLSSDDIEASGTDASGTAWQVFSFIDIIIFLACLAGIALLVTSATANPLRSTLAPVTVGLGGLAVLLILFRIISPPDLAGNLGDAIPPGVDVEVVVGLGIGVFLGLIAALGVTYGGFLAMRDGDAESAAPPPAPAAPPAPPA